MAGIDAKVVLGLAGKVGQVFVDEGTYQAFPLTPIGLKAASLRALVDDQFGAGAAAHAQFSLLVNEIPTGPLWLPRGKRLWEVYGEVLSRAVLQEKPLKPPQQKAYDKAFRLLWDAAVTPPRPSRRAVAYERFRDAYIAATMEYNNRRGQALTAAADPAVVEAWEKDEPGLRAEVERAAEAWAGPGRRAEVEEARRVLRDLGSTSPAAAWAGFRKLFDPDLPEIFFRTSVEGLTYLPTGYVPTDVADLAWARMTVTADELDALAAQAPQELRTRLGSSADAGIAMVSFEYSYVTVSRAWFTPDVFATKGWRFHDPDRVLSDGGSPPRGECTAYVTGLVLAREITVQRTEGAAPPAADLGFLPNLAAMTTMDFQTLPSLQEAAPAPDQLQMVVLDDPAAWQATHAFAGPLATEAGASEPVVGESTLDPGARVLQVSDAFRSLRHTELHVRALDPALLEPVADAPSASSSGEVTTAPDEVYVLAFQCRLLPRSPASAKGPGGAGRVHVVVAGDTLSKLAARFYGDASRWRRLYDANRTVIGPDPGLLRVGQRLRIP